MAYRLTCPEWFFIKSHSTPARNLPSKTKFLLPLDNQLSWQKFKLKALNLIFQVPRNKNCRSSGESFSIATVSLLIVPLIMLAFFSWSITIRDSTESSMTRRVMTQGRVCPIRWQRSALCHSAAGFHQLQDISWYVSIVFRSNTYGSTMKTLEASVRFKATPPAFKLTRKTSTSELVMK